MYRASHSTDLLAGSSGIHTQLLHSAASIPVPASSHLPHPHTALQLLATHVRLWNPCEQRQIYKSP